jgi:hypothetical protein
MKRNKTGGRTKGTLNRTTAETKELIQNVINSELDGISDLLAELQPKERLDTIIKLLPYIVPKQSEIAVENKERFSTITVNIVPPIDYDDDD